MKKLWLILALLLVASPALAFCDNVSVSVTEPIAQNYTYSINLPAVYTPTNATVCWIELIGNKYSDTIYFPGCSGVDKFDVDYDDDYQLQMWVSNTTSGDTCNDNVTFSVDRTSDFEEGKPVMLGIVVGILIIISFWILHFSTQLEDSFKVICKVVSFLLVYSALTISLLIAREYIKVPAIEQNMEVVFTGVIFFGVLIAMLIMFMFIINTIRRVTDTARNVKIHGK